MADELDALLERVGNEALRTELVAQIDRLRLKREFGLVFESHLPERVRLPDHPIRRGASVVRRSAPVDATPQPVLQVSDDTALLAADDDASEEVPLDDLVVVAEFGEPIYPGLRRLGSVDRGGDKPAHVVINSENYHALEALRFSYAGKVDCIYIDPPYNTGARDWKYDNDYVDADDGYRHSKWLAFMERRLRLAKELLNPDDSVLIVTIDEKEYLRLGLLLEQLFPDAIRQMVTIVINPLGQARRQELARVEEYAFFVFLGEGGPASLADDLLSAEPSGSKREKVRWEWLLRGGEARRADRPNLFYPIYIDPSSRQVVEVGEPLGPDEDRGVVPDREGCVTVWPLRINGDEGRWRTSPKYLRELLASGYAKVGAHDKSKDRWSILYLGKAQIRRIEEGELRIVGRDPSGAVQLERTGIERVIPKTVWNRPSHRAGEHGTNLLKRFVPGRAFPFPKSLYAVEDTLRVAVSDKPNAIVLDFFVGSGTTTHAVMRLNRQDGGRRQSIVVTNNEVSSDEADALRQAGHRPGDPEWERLGIFEHVTRPRITTAVTGETPDGERLKGKYKFKDKFPMADGFEENVTFLELNYLDIEDVELNLAFEAVASLLWLRAGAVGPAITELCDESGRPKVFDMTARYGVLFDPDHWRSFVRELPESVTTVFIVTDSPSEFAGIAAELPSGVDVVRLYENYLATFAINREL